MDPIEVGLLAIAQFFEAVAKRVKPKGAQDKQSANPKAPHPGKK
jgi:hypothetical protein